MQEVKTATSGPWYIPVREMYNMYKLCMTDHTEKMNINCDSKCVCYKDMMIALALSC